VQGDTGKQGSFPPRRSCMAQRAVASSPLNGTSLSEPGIREDENTAKNGHKPERRAPQLPSPTHRHTLAAGIHHTEPGCSKHCWEIAAESSWARTPSQNFSDGQAAVEIGGENLKAMVLFSRTGDTHRGPPPHTHCPADHKGIYSVESLVHSVYAGLFFPGIRPDRVRQLSSDNHELLCVQWDKHHCWEL